MRVDYKKPEPLAGKVTIVLNSDQAMVLAELLELIAWGGPVREFTDQLGEMIQGELKRDIQHGTHFLDSAEYPSTVYANPAAEVSDVEF
jgi:hypothetical protein